MSQSPTIVLLTGPPGAGKGTQAALIAEEHQWHTFSIGQILRSSARPEIKANMDAGDLLSKEHVVTLVIDQLEASQMPTLVDGFPRRLDQAEAFDEAADQRGLGEFLVVSLMITPEESWRRVSGRGREDDGRETWEHRWEEFHQYTEPAIAYCRDRGNLIELDGDGDIATVRRRIEQALGL